ncbi:MAG TPA: 3-phosphoshikimate 1-carboxyvinyltransferase [Candidatus Omnitrophota bacterium]|nr:3-phosphoshikimate 1-carboxyvinyltransferase [Candidatus Omnitrophota bacterium]HPT39788.1 3-phosphoshikimate 1-carboxyvinyltransferase [Candidatus Omnitrophota bacterium]
MSGISKTNKRQAAKFPALRQPVSIKDKFILRGRISLPGDKSIAHRALILSSLASGTTILKNFPIHDDSLATLNALKALGVKILRRDGLVFIYGRGSRGLQVCRRPVLVNNSGTTLRLLLGVLAGMNFKTKIIAGKYLSCRPMSRVNVPLRLMGAQITARVRNNEEYAPIVIKGGSLKGIVYHPKVASAQVKSAILLAGLFAEGKTQVYEMINTRDHTERMLKIFGANIATDRNRVTLEPNRNLISPGRIYIPGDLSSASFFMVLAAILPKAKIVLEHSSLNPSRCGLINVLKKMKAKIKVQVSKPGRKVSFEPSGSITVSSSKLKGAQVSAEQVPSLIDELPILMVAACFAQGRTIIKGVGELRVKETDRINSMVVNLKKMGADVQVQKAGRLESIVIKGQGRLYGAKLKSFGDHRTAMSMVVAACAAEGSSRLDDINCVNKSFPGFLGILNSLSGK